MWALSRPRDTLKLANGEGPEDHDDNEDGDGRPTSAKTATEDDGSTSRWEHASMDSRVRLAGIGMLLSSNNTFTRLLSQSSHRTVGIAPWADA